MSLFTNPYEDLFSGAATTLREDGTVWASPQVIEAAAALMDAFSRHYAVMDAVRVARKPGKAEAAALALATEIRRQQA